jgi:hypothetical protein
MKTILLLLLSGSFFLSGCTGSKRVSATSSEPRLIFLDTLTVNFGKSFDHTTVGGLSGIDYNEGSNRFYLICDDRSNINPARFYTAEINLSSGKLEDVDFRSVHYLKDTMGNNYPDSKTDPTRTPDPESIRYWKGRDQLVWSSEGERASRNGKFILADPSINITDSSGKYQSSFPIPAHCHMNAEERGPRQNGVFEGLSFSPDYKKLFVSIEEPLYEDGPRADIVKNGAVIRILEYDPETKQLLHEYAYHPDPVAKPSIPASDYKINGIPEILALSGDRLLIMERSFSSGQAGCVVKIFLADLRNATDVKQIPSLKNSKFTAASKKLLFNLNALGFYIDNVEGFCFGPKLPNGKQSLLMVADNNFNPAEKMQFFLFEWEP